MKKLYIHFKKHLIRGILAVIPIGLTIIVLVILYTNIDRPIISIMNRLIGFSIPGFGILILLILLYSFGLIVSNFLGKRFLSLFETITTHIPIIKTFYIVGKQISGAFSMPHATAFKRTILVQYLSPGQWTLGFITGIMYDEGGGEPLYRVYVPTPPLPTSGVIIIVKESQTRDAGMSVEDALKIIMSCGIIGPEMIGGPMLPAQELPPIQK